MGTKSFRKLKLFKKEKGREILLLAPLFILLMFFLLIPFLSVIKESFYDSFGKLSLINYKNIFQKSYMEALKNSLSLSIATSLLGVIFGTIISFYISKSKGMIREWLYTITSLPLTFSGLIIAYSFMITLGSSGTLTLILQKIFGIEPLEFSSYLYTWKGLTVAYLYFQIPRMIIIMISAWGNLDWSLVEAADSLGAGTITIIKRVVIPVLWPSILAGSVLLFAVSMGAYGTALALTGVSVNILPLTIYTQVSDVSYNLPQADALSVLLTFVTTFSIYVYRRTFAKM
jgi:ABC-type uncharacterized transport system permease subunit